MRNIFTLQNQLNETLGEIASLKRGIKDNVTIGPMKGIDDEITLLLGRSCNDRIETQKSAVNMKISLMDDKVKYLQEEAEQRTQDLSFLKATLKSKVSAELNAQLSLLLRSSDTFLKTEIGKINGRLFFIEKSKMELQSGLNDIWHHGIQSVLETLRFDKRIIHTNKRIVRTNDSNRTVRTDNKMNRDIAAISAGNIYTNTIIRSRKSDSKITDFFMDVASTTRVKGDPNVTNLFADERWENEVPLPLPEPRVGHLLTPAHNQIPVVLPPNVTSLTNQPFLPSRNPTPSPTLPSSMPAMMPSPVKKVPPPIVKISPPSGKDLREASTSSSNINLQNMQNDPPNKGRTYNTVYNTAKKNAFTLKRKSQSK